MPSPRKPEDQAPVREIRAFQPIEVRAAEGDGLHVRGYAAVFDQPTQIGDWFIEKVARGAFTDTLKTRGQKGASEDVVFLVDHRGQPLARTRSGTLTLSEDDKGLLMETMLDDVDPDAVSVVRKMSRGDLDKMSFAFRATEETWVEVEGQLPVRTIVKAELFDVSVVTDPAYDCTEIGLRSLAAFRSGIAGISEFSNRAALARMRMKHAHRARGTV